MLKSSVMRHFHWSGSFWHFEGLWSNAEDKAVDSADSRIHSSSNTASHSSCLESSALLLWEQKNLAASVVLGIVVVWLAVVPCVWVVGVADHGLESRCPEWHFTRKIQGSISSYDKTTLDVPHPFKPVFHYHSAFWQWVVWPTEWH
jgi:hypothetical protein